MKNNCTNACTESLFILNFERVLIFLCLITTSFFTTLHAQVSQNYSDGKIYVTGGVTLISIDESLPKISKDNKVVMKESTVKDSLGVKTEIIFYSVQKSFRQKEIIAKTKKPNLKKAIEDSSKKKIAVIHKTAPNNYFFSHSSRDSQIRKNGAISSEVFTLPQVQKYFFERIFYECRYNKYLFPTNRNYAAIVSHIQYLFSKTYTVRPPPVS